MASTRLTDELVYQVRDGVATLTLNRPEKLNACTTAMYDGLVEAAAAADEDETVKVLVLTGAGRGFCAGSDASERLAARVEGKKAQGAGGDLLRPVGYFGRALYEFGKPTIAAVNGVCAGSGLSLALLCDIRIASDKARFGAVWVRRGLVPDVGATGLLPRTVGLDRAMEMAFTGELLDAEEALRIGLVTRVVPHEGLEAAVEALARKIARGPSVAIALIKRGMRRSAPGDYAAQLEFESYAQNVCFGTEDFKESLDAFLEKREPRFRGR
ncbi:MAG: hypothetical protein DRH20_04390 [Deltaproteobacteria bacterium]|nr:MAG: hypothetical protein DRH20_04390 [Deltaproteobacteria bacterium]